MGFAYMRSKDVLEYCKSSQARLNLNLKEKIDSVLLYEFNIFGARGDAKGQDQRPHIDQQELTAGAASF